MDWDKQIKDAMKKINSSAAETAGSRKPGNFDKNELAYLAFTSKIERPIRDKFAWVLHESLKDYHVTREYGEGRSKYDVAILDKKNKVKVLIEFKAINIFWFLGGAGSKKWMDDDIEKMKNVLGVKKYFIQLVNCPSKRLSDDYKCLVASSHFKRLNQLIDLHGIEDPFENVTKKWETIIEEKKYDFEKGVIEAGKLHGNRLTIPYWIINPKK